MVHSDDVIEHGVWTPYVPDPWPTGLPSGIGFLRNGDGLDWYDFQAGVDPQTFKSVVVNGIVVSTHMDISMLFPSDGLLIETANPVTVGMQYSAGALSDAPAPIPKSATKLGLKRAFEEAGTWEQIRTAIASNASVKEEWDLAIEIKRNDPLVQMMAGLQNFDEAAIDHLLVRAAALVE